MSIRLSKEPYRSNNSIYGKENLQTAKKLYAKMQKPEIPIFLLLVENIVKSLNTLTGALTNPKKFYLNQNFNLFRTWIISSGKVDVLTQQIPLPWEGDLIFRPPELKHPTSLYYMQGSTSFYIPSLFLTPPLFLQVKDVTIT